MIKLVLLPVVLLLGMHLAKAQSTETNYLNTVRTENYLEQIRQVYGSERMEQHPELVEQLTILLQERVHLSYQPGMPAEKCPLISSVGLHNKYNPQLTAIDPATFSPGTFNPLIYNWEYFSDNYQTFRIDGTGYVLVIDPQNLQKH